MPWGWKERPRQSIEVGGSKGTYSDASKVSTWPNYEAAYLAKRLGSTQASDAAYANRYSAGSDGALWAGDEASRQVYLDKVATDFKSEADECLKAEFMDWLQGTHKDNDESLIYPNRPGQAKRRAIGPTTELDPATGQPSIVSVGETLREWRPTWWGKNQLTHLNGVREFLREKKTRAEEHEFAMNVLAEFGPNTIDQAWTYFKHWVKGQPVSPEECLSKSTSDATVNRSGPISMAENRGDLLDAKRLKPSPPPFTTTPLEPLAPPPPAPSIEEVIVTEETEAFIKAYEDSLKKKQAKDKLAAAAAAYANTELTPEMTQNTLATASKIANAGQAKFEDAVYNADIQSIVRERNKGTLSKRLGGGYYSAFPFRPSTRERAMQVMYERYADAVDDVAKDMPVVGEIDRDQLAQDRLRQMNKIINSEARGLSKTAGAPRTQEDKEREEADFIALRQQNRRQRASATATPMDDEPDLA